MLSTEELQAIKERYEKATLGDWGFVPIENHVEYFIFGEGGNEAVAESVYTKDDADFIANARQDIPNLLAEIERLQTELEKYRRQHFEQMCDEWVALSYGEFEDEGVIVNRHEQMYIKGWWAYYEVEFTFTNKQYAFKYRKHTSPNCCDRYLTEDIHEVGNNDD